LVVVSFISTVTAIQTKLEGDDKMEWKHWERRNLFFAMSDPNAAGRRIDSL